MLIQLPPKFKFPDKFYIACSGGVDSMALVSFLLQSKKEFSVLHFNHGTPMADLYEEFVREFCAKNNLNISVRKCELNTDTTKSIELFWAEERHKFFNSFDTPVLLAHHLNDAVETWLMSCLNGKPHVMSMHTRNCIRPLLLTPKANLITWCRTKGIYWMEDSTNSEDICQRNLIRNKLLPEALKVNPGLLTVVAKMILNCQ